MKLLKTLLLLCLVYGCAEDPGPAESPASQEASLILVNGRVYTLAWDEPRPDGTASPEAPRDSAGWYPDAQAVAIRDGEILFAGSSVDAMQFEGDSTRIVNLGGATVIPGLVDSHTHVFGLGALLRQVDLTDVEDAARAHLLAADDQSRAALDGPGREARVALVALDGVLDGAPVRHHRVGDAGLLCHAPGDDRLEHGVVGEEPADPVAPDDLGQIFDPFYTTKRGQGGSGHRPLETVYR